MRKLTCYNKSDDSTCIVYDANLRIIHMHQFVACQGADKPSNAEIEREAIEIACRIYEKSSVEMKTIHIPTQEIDIGVEYEKVDLERKSLVKKLPEQGGS